MVNINNFFLKELYFSDGSWVGKFEFIMYIDDESVIGIAPFTYSKKFYIHGLTYPFSISNEQRKEVRKLVIQAAKPYLETLQQDIFNYRESFSFKPQIEQFKVDEQQSFFDNITVHFKLKESPIEFLAYIFLFQNAWQCEIKPKTDYKNDDYKRYMQWEDDVFEQLLIELKNIPSYRMKLVVNSIQYKHKK